MAVNLLPPLLGPTGKKITWYQLPTEAASIIPGVLAGFYQVTLWNNVATVTYPSNLQALTQWSASASVTLPSNAATVTLPTNAQTVEVPSNSVVANLSTTKDIS